jgi:tetratricopeptide (TPR) repeat protein
MLTAQLYVGREKYNKAIKLCLKARNITPSSSSVLFCLANAYFFGEYYKEAKEILSKVLSLEPNNVAALRLMIHTLVELNASTEEIIPCIKSYLENAELHQFKFPYIIRETISFMTKIFKKKIDLHSYERQADKDITDFYLWARKVVEDFERENK